MAIVTINNLSGNEADIGKANDSKRKQSWRITTDTRYQDSVTLLRDGITAGYLPIPHFSFHPVWPQFLCKRLRANQDQKAPLVWVAVAEYDTVPEPVEDDQDTNPLDRRAKITWNTNKYQKAVERDRDNKAVLNSAGDYFDPPPLKDLSRWTMTVKKNVAVVPPAILDYPDAVNDNEWDIPAAGLTVPKNVAKIMAISIGDLQKEGDTEYYEFTYTIEFDKIDEWKGKYLNQGFYQIDDNGERKRCRVNGKDCVSPQMLDADGKQIDDPTPALATYQEYDVYREMDFSILPVE